VRRCAREGRGGMCAGLLGKKWMPGASNIPKYDLIIRETKQQATHPSFIGIGQYSQTTCTGFASALRKQ